MPRASRHQIVAGIDVGGPGKGFHAVALRDGKTLAAFSSTVVAEIVDWCRRQQPRVIGIDAPCRWSVDGRARHAERELMQSGVWCFSTPTSQAAAEHPKDHYGWMLNGQSLLQQLTPSHPLCEQLPLPRPAQACFETFPHAIACALAGRRLNARHKRRDRRALLTAADIDATDLTNIDLVDAALCALAAHHVATRQPCRAYGEPTTGLIIVPASPGRPTA